MSILRVDSIQLNAAGNAGVSISNTWNVSISAGGLEGLVVQTTGDVVVNNRLIIKASGLNYAVNTAIESAFSTANLALTTANSSGATIAIAAFNQANVASASNPVANGAYAQANAAYAQANLGGNKIGTTGFFNFNDVEIGEDIISIATKIASIANISANNGSGTITLFPNPNPPFLANDIIQFVLDARGFPCSPPLGTNANTNYYIISTTANTLNSTGTITISATRGGPAINLRNTGFGSFDVYKPVNASAVGPVTLANGSIIVVYAGSTLAIL